MAKRKKVEATADGERVTSYRSRAIRKVGYDIFFACDHPLVGTVLPGRGGGRITGCVTPSKKHPHELQLNVGLPNVGRPFRLSTVRDRLRGKTAWESAGTTEGRKLATLEAVERFRLDAIPAPVGRVYPGRPGSSRCDPEHAVWSGYDEAIELAAEEAPARLEDPEHATEREYREAMRATLQAQNPARFNVWDAVTRSCVETYEKTFSRSKGYESPQKAKARERAAFIRAGGDPGSGDWTDTLADSTKRKRAPKPGRAPGGSKRSRAKPSKGSKSSKGSAR